MGEAMRVRVIKLGRAITNLGDRDLIVVQVSSLSSHALVKHFPSLSLNGYR